MSLSLPPSITNLEQRDRSEWRGVLLEASLKLVKIAINHSEKQVKLTTSAAATLLSKDPLSTHEKAALTEFETQKRRELEAVKLRKLERDNIPNPSLYPDMSKKNYMNPQQSSSITNSTHMAKIIFHALRN